jgi:hypothetical protein
MRAVAIRLPPRELSTRMGAMRIWLDEHRFEPSSFACRDSEYGVLVCLEFKIARQAEEFAERFGGREDEPLDAQLEDEAIGKILETDLLPSGVVG